MQGVLIASADTAVRKSLSAILGPGKTVYECPTMTDSLALAAAHKMDYLFVDDIFADGNAENLVHRLHLLGYGIEIIPMMLSPSQRHMEVFRKYSVHHCITKPFDVGEIKQVLDHIEQLTQAQEIEPRFPDFDEKEPAQTLSPSVPPGFYPRHWESAGDVDIREISHRFQRLLARSLKRGDLIRTFADNMQEQFDVDNVVVLLPALDEPCFRIAYGHVEPQAKDQFFIPFESPLVAAMIRYGEPIWVHDRERLGRQNAITAMRYGERLGIELLCPVVSRGRALAFVGLSRFHRYGSSPFLLSLLRLFLTFFAKALENADLYDTASTAEQTYRDMLDAMPLGTLGVSAEGMIRHVNPTAASFLRMSAEELEGQPVERAGSRLAGMARNVLHTGEASSTQKMPMPKGETGEVSAVPLQHNGDGDDGVLLLFRTPPPKAPDEAPGGERSSEELLHNMSGMIAHNFKNAMVPLKTCAELLPERYASEDFRNSFFQVVSESIGQIDQWIAQLLDLTSVAENAGSKEAFSMWDAVEKSLQEALAEYPHLTLTPHKSHEETDLVSANRKHVEQAVLQLIRNALDAIQDIPNPKLDVRIVVNDDMVQLLVTDNGSGLDDVARSSAVDPFFTTKLKGLGLGLSYATRVAESHGGSLRVEPGESAGTVATLELPKESEVPAKSTPVPQSTT